MLELMSAPKKWEMGDGEVAEVATPWTTRARELQVQTGAVNCINIAESHHTQHLAHARTVLK